MKAYLGDLGLKSFVLEQLAKHRELDRIVKGTYWSSGKGCAVGCTLAAVAARNGKFTKGINHGNHTLYASELGIPEQLAYLQDAIFEGLPSPDYLQWPEQFAEAIKPGVDLSKVWPKFVVALLTDPAGPVWPYVQDKKFREQLAAIKKVADLYRDGMPTIGAAEAAGDAAWAAARAAWDAAEAAARAAARDAAEAAGDAAEAAARAAARDAAEAAARAAARAAAEAAGDAARDAWAAARAAARAAAYRWQRDLLLRLIREAN